MKVEIYLFSRLSVKLAPPNPERKLAKATAEKRERDGVPREKGKADIGKDENKPYKNGRAKAEQHRKLRGLGCPRDCLNFCLLCASGDCSI